MAGLKPWVSNPDADAPFQVAFPQASVTNPDATLGSPGGYTVTTQTKSPGAGELKEFAGGTAMKTGTKNATPFRGKKGQPRPDTVAKLKNVPRAIIPS